MGGLMAHKVVKLISKEGRQSNQLNYISLVLYYEYIQNIVLIGFPGP